MRRVARQLVSMSVVLTVAMVGMGTAHALISTTQPQLTLNHFIRTSPFVGTSTKVSDNEGSAYVASDDAFWMADDNGDALWEVDRTTGALRRKLAQSAFINAPRFGVGGTAGQSRTEDLEALAYDANADIIYAFSGSTSATPTVFRLTRDASHQFQVESWQPLPSEWTGAGWRSADGLTYVVNGSTFRTYDFATNTFGPSFSISGLSHVYGIDFDDATGDLLAVNSSQRLYRASMSSSASPRRRSSSSTGTEPTAPRAHHRAPCSTRSSCSTSGGPAGRARPRASPRRRPAERRHSP